MERPRKNTPGNTKRQPGAQDIVKAIRIETRGGDHFGTQVEIGHEEVEYVTRVEKYPVLSLSVPERWIIVARMIWTSEILTSMTLFHSRE